MSLPLWNGTYPSTPASDVTLRSQMSSLRQLRRFQSGDYFEESIDGPEQPPPPPPHQAVDVPDSETHTDDHDDHPPLLAKEEAAIAPKGRSLREYGLAVAEALVVLLFGLFVTLDPQARPDTPLGPEAAKDVVQSLYPFFQDVHVMIFIGFGFLMTFVKTHRWGALSFTFILSIWALQWGVLSSGFWHQLIPGGHGGWHRIELSLTTLITGDFEAAAAMITFGALLGKCTLPQLAFLVWWEMLIVGLAEALCLQYFKAMDLGGSMVLHTFGAYFGLTASYFFQPKKAAQAPPPVSYDSQTVAMVGTLFLWLYWPSFNGALASGAAQHRAIINTVLSIGGSCIGSACLTRILLGKLEMEVMLNATLAGGVAMGSACDIVTAPWAALLIGLCAGALSSLGFRVIGPFLQRRANLQDTCGVHSLHGMPGILGAIVSMIAIALADTPPFPSDYFPVVADGGSKGGQILAQVYSLLTALGLAIAGGLVGGFLCSLRPFRQLTFFHHDDDHFWEVCE